MTFPWHQLFRPLSITTAVAMLALHAGCAGHKEDAMSAKKKIPFVVMSDIPTLSPIAEEPDLIPLADIEVGPQGYWLRSEGSLARLHLGANSASVAIDWKLHQALLVTLGVQGTTGHAIRLLGVEIQGDTLRVSIQHVEPKGSVGEALTHPATLLRIDTPVGDLQPVLNIDGKDTACHWHILN